MSQHDQSRPLRSTGELLVVILEAAWAAARQVAKQVRPLVEPPCGLRIVGSDGMQYSGLLVVDRGTIVGGIVVQTGFEPATAQLDLHQQHGAPLDEHLARRRHDPMRLAGWADDPRSLHDEDGGPWRR